EVVEVALLVVPVVVPRSLLNHIDMPVFTLLEVKKIC
ncbi:hypothetical protein AWRI1631_42210, partial [Saccharomyces cerevisiae AWRI1631]